jgi:hypothetical protein
VEEACRRVEIYEENSYSGTTLLYIHHPYNLHLSGMRGVRSDDSTHESSFVRITSFGQRGKVKTHDGDGGAVVHDEVHVCFRYRPIEDCGVVEMSGIVNGPMAFGVSDRLGRFQLIAFPNQEIKMHLSTEK